MHLRRTEPLDDAKELFVSSVALQMVESIVTTFLEQGIANKLVCPGRLHTKAEAMAKTIRVLEYVAKKRHGNGSPFQK